MKKTNFFRRVLPLLTLLFLSVTSAWGALNNTTTTKTGSSQKFLDVATVVASSGDEVTVENQYAAYTITELVANTIKGVWYTQSSSSSGSNESANVTATGFRSKNSKYISVTSSNTHTFYVHGAVGVAVLYDPRSNNRKYTITATNVDNSTDKVTITDSQTMSSGNQYVLNLTNLDASKYYQVVVKSSDGSGTRMFQLRVEGATSSDPSIRASNVTLESDATSGEISYTISNPATGVNPTAEITTGDWISNVAVNTSTKKVTFDATANIGNTDRTATITISYTGAEDKVVTITQKKFVVDYVTLPFSLAAGIGKESLPAGVTQSGLDTDYADEECKLKFNGAGDYIVIKTNQALGIFSFGLKMLGGTTSSTMTVKESSDGTAYTNVESFSTSGSDKSTLFTFTTTNAFNSATRYVKLEMTAKGSNVGVGPITIEEYVAPAPRTVNFNGSGNGTPASASLTEASTAAGVTLPTVNNVTAGYQFLGWTATENGTTVDAGLTAGATYKPKKDITLYAVYGKVDYDITNQIEGATVTIKKNGTAVTKANVGDVITLSASKDEYAVSEWDVKDASSNAVTVTDNQFTMPASNVTINATFAEAAQSNPAIYRATLTSKTAATVTGSIGGTVALSLQDADSKYKFGGVSNYITITLPAGQTFNEGDVLNIHTDKAAEANNNTIALFASNSAKANADVLQSQANFTALGDNKIILNSAFENLNTLTIARTSTYNWNGYVDYVEVTRQPANLTDPTCSATATAFNPECKAAVEMSVTANNYVYLQWYSCDAEGNDAVAIAGANTASYTYTSTAAEEGTTKYFYCAAVNPKATNKTAKSAVISVAVKRLPRYTITATLPEGGSYTVNAQAVDEEHNSFETIEGATITMTTTADGTHQLHSTPFVVKDADETDVKVSKSGDNYTFTMPAKAVTVTAQYVPTYAITAGSCEHGSVEVSTSRTSKLSKVTVTPTAAEHYHISAVYYVKEGEETHNAISATDDVYSFSMVASNITVYAEFEEDDNVTITWSINGNTDRTSKVYVDEAIEFPADVEDVAGKKFQGWVAEADKEYSNATTAPTYVTEEVASEAKTFYAVFATAEGNFSTDYSKITTMANLTDGNYVIAYDYNGGTQIAMGNTVNASNYFSASALSLTDSKYANPDADYIWSIKKVSEGVYSLYNADVNKYAQATSLGVSLVDNPYNFTITWDASNNCFRIQSTTDDTYYLHGYVNGSSYDFRSSTAGNGVRYHLHLYKNESTVTYSNFTTTVATSGSFSVSSYEWTTYYTDHAFVMPANAIGYIVDMNSNDELALVEKYAAEDIVPANTPIIINAEARTYDYNITAEDGETPDNNYLHGQLDAGRIIAETGENYYYKLSTKDGVLGFYWGAADGGVFDLTGDNRAYMVLPQSMFQTEAPARICFAQWTTDTATGVENLENSEDVVKFMENGQLFILRNGVLYNAIGQVVK